MLPGMLTETRIGSKGFGLEVKVTGQNELEEEPRSLGRKALRAMLRKAFRGAAKIVQAEYKRLVPRRSGLYKQAIKVRAIKRRKHYVGAVAVVDKKSFKDAFYSGFVEWGTKTAKGKERIKAGHYGEQAFKNVNRKALDFIIDTLRTELGLAKSWKQAPEE